MRRIAAGLERFLEIVLRGKRDAPILFRWLLQLCAGLSVLFMVRLLFVLVGAGPDIAIGDVLFYLSQGALFSVFAYGIYNRARWVPDVVPWLAFVQYAAIWTLVYATQREPFVDAAHGLAFALIWAVAFFAYCRRPLARAYFRRSNIGTQLK